MEKSKNFIPLLINLKDKRVLIVGGGNAALLKAKGFHLSNNHYGSRDKRGTTQISI
jgi:regulator of replication initiation timing